MKTQGAVAVITVFLEYCFFIYFNQKFPWLTQAKAGDSASLSNNSKRLFYLIAYLLQKIDSMLQYMQKADKMTAKGE